VPFALSQNNHIITYKRITGGWAMKRSYKLYVSGVDEQMEEGIPEKHTILLTGTPGTMKSSLAYNILYQNAKNEGVRGLYLTLEQDRDNFQYHLSKLGMGEQIEDKVRLFDMSTTREQWLKIAKAKGEAVEGEEKVEVGKTRDLETFKRQIEALKGPLGYDLLVIDSLPVVEMMFGMKNPREELFHFFKWLKKLKVTTILITEMSQDSPKYSKHDVDFLADGIVKVSMVQMDPTTTQRHIQVVKMRGVNHTTNPFSLNFKEGGFGATRVIM
jgi:KaiC/GvpD/RAD55 family RecA-like ATPase